MRTKNNYAMRRLAASKNWLFPTVELFMLNMKEYQGLISHLMLQWKEYIKEEQYQKVEKEDQWERGKEVEVFSVVLKNS